MVSYLIIGIIVFQFIILVFLYLQIRDLISQTNNIEKNQTNYHQLYRDDFLKSQEFTLKHIQNNREEMAISLKEFRESLLSYFSELSNLQKNHLESFAKQLSQLTQLSEQKFNQLRNTIEKRLSQIQSDNNEKLEKMRQTVDEKLHATLEKRLANSFGLVNDRLEKVHKGLGEMQTLASGVGDLKKVFTNIKTRGVWGEIQLGNLLDQILSPDQYASNVKIKKSSNEFVEYAIKLPGQSNQNDDPVWLPLDSKLPQDSYENLLLAQETGVVESIMKAGKKLEIELKKEAKLIHDKYLDPPNTTDFGIMFLPIESLYSEILRRPGLLEILQNKYRVVIAGPTTFAALLNSLQMGFRTLAIEKRSSEVWQILSAVKIEFGKFGDILHKTQKKLHEAGNTIDDAMKKTKTIHKRLTNVQELPKKEHEVLELKFLE